MHLIELVPRDLQSVEEDAGHILTHFSRISGINIPDITRLPIRSYDVARTFLKRGFLVVPHIRSIDFTEVTAKRLFEGLVADGLTHVLIVSGDNDGLSKSIQGLSSLTLISLLKRWFPHLLVYGALDPYRRSSVSELDYCHQKLDVGCDGFFTQPFFNTHHAESFLQALSHTQLFIGVSPVTTQKSKTYWEIHNHVQFSPTFQLDLDYNLALARQLIQLADRYAQHTYHMPIKVDAREYLLRLLG